MHLPSHPARAQGGFTLAELMIAVTLGLLILAGMTTLFVNNTKAQGEIEKANRQVENGRFAVALLSGDLRNAGFYGEFDPTVLATPAALPDPCLLTLDALKTALPLHVQGYDNPAAASVGCITDLRAGTDVLVLRHTRTCVAGESNCDPVSAGGPFFQASLCSNPSELDSGDPRNFYALDIGTATLDRHRRDCSQVAGSGTLAPIRAYTTHLYFVANNDNPGDGIPTLKRAELGSSGGVLGMTIVPLVEGIDNLQIEYGIDTNGDGVPDLYAANPNLANGCATAACAPVNWRNVVAVKLNILARNLEATQSYTDNKSYVLGLDGGGSANTVAAAGDHYKRHVFHAVVNLPNPSGRKVP
ncbi:MAG: PilW family protein [Pseudomonadota bacterium]|nr:PilW family protein [Pseudomonadota bacterium]